MDLRNITLVSVGYIEEVYLRSVIDTAGKEFSLPVVVREGFIDISEFFDPTRRQYNGTKLLKEIDILFGSDNTKTIGLFSIDLFIPILTYIFGQAYLKGRTGIASYYRLSNDRYGMTGNGKNGVRKTMSGWKDSATKNPAGSGLPMNAAIGKEGNETNGSGKRTAAMSGKCADGPGKANMNGMSGNDWKTNGTSIGCGKLRLKSLRQ